MNYFYAYIRWAYNFVEPALAWAGIKPDSDINYWWVDWFIKTAFAE